MTPPPATEVLDRLRSVLRSLPNVTTRKTFGNQGYYAGGGMFAALTDHSQVVRLPPTVLTEALRAGYARPFLSFGVASLTRWVEIPFSAAPPDTLERLLRSAYDAGRHVHGASPHRRPARARKRRTPAKGEK